MTDLVDVKINGKYRITLPKHRADRPDWYTDEGWERKRLDKLADYIEIQEMRGFREIVYYVGAEEGEMPALCQMWGAQVVLFEPNQKVWPNIKLIWEANKLKAPLGVFPGFAANETNYHPKNLDFDPAIDETGWPLCADGAVISDHGFRELYQENTAVPSVKIDDYVASSGNIPTVIVFDVEGSEWEVLKGAEKTIVEHRPILFASIHPEFMFHQFGAYSRDFRNWIIDHYYDETIVDYQHELHTIYVPRKDR